MIAKIYSRTALGICKNSMVLGDSQKKRTYVQSPQDREWVSMVETVSALGRSTRPIAIFKGKTSQTTWFRHNEVPDWIYIRPLRTGGHQIKTKAITNPPSPPSPNHDDIDVLATPKSHHDVYHMIQSLDNGHMTQRETQAILRKAGKRIGQLAAQNAVSESKIRSLEAQLEELRGPKTRKRVVVDPNTKFANIDAIKKAMDEATEQGARIKAREPEKEAKKDGR
jgi:hypothetical protein